MQHVNILMHTNGLSKLFIVEFDMSTYRWQADKAEVFYVFVSGGL